MLKKSLPIFILAALQFGCAEQAVRQDPAPVHRGKARATIHQSQDKTVEVFKYPESPEIQVQPQLPEAQPVVPPVPQNITPAPVPQPQTAVPSAPAILALIAEADQNVQTGNYESGAVKIERALRIDARNANLTYKLAEIRLKQEQPRLAEDLAKKAALLAETNHELKKRCWLLIAEAKRLQNDPDGAQQAEQKAAQF